MFRMGVYDQIKSAFQDIIAPELHSLRAEVARLNDKVDTVDARLGTRIDSLDARLSDKIDALDGRLSARIDGTNARLDSFRAEMMSMRNELISEILRIDTRID